MFSASWRPKLRIFFSRMNSYILVQLSDLILCFKNVQYLDYSVGLLTVSIVSILLNISF